MRALVLREDSFGVEHIDQPVEPNDAHGPYTRIIVRAAALNHRDQYIREGRYAGIQLPAVLGSDVCGISLDGMRVVVNPSHQWGEHQHSQSRNYHVLGMPTMGGFAEEVVVPLGNVYPAPDHLSDVEAAALPLAGVTAYRAVVVQGTCSASDTVLITGIGGGVSTMAMNIALAIGADVVVSSRHEHKLETARAFARDQGHTIRTVLLSDANTYSSELKKLSPTLIVDSIGGDLVNVYLNGIAPGGRIVVYGASAGSTPNLNLHRIFWKQIQLIGSTMGSDNDFAHMLRFVNEHQLKPLIDKTYPLEQAVDAFSRMAAAEQVGKIVLTLV